MSAGWCAGALGSESKSGIQVDGRNREMLLAGVTHGTSVARPWPSVIGEGFWPLLHAAEAHRLLGALAEAAADGALVLDDERRAQLANVHRRWAAQSLRVERVLVRIARAYHDADIPFRVLKGASVAHLVHSDPSWRVTSDLDLIVPTDSLDDAVSVAVSIGGEVVVPELRAGFGKEFGKELVVRLDGVDVDLHRTLVEGPFGLMIDLSELLACGRRFDVGGLGVAGLAPTDLALHACYTLAHDTPPRLAVMRDLLLSIERSGVTSADILQRAQPWQAEAVVQRAGAIVCDTLAIDEHPIAELSQADVLGKQAMMMRVVARGGNARRVASLAAIPGLMAKLRYLQALVAPSRAYLDALNLTRREHLERLLLPTGLYRR